jgi:histidine kinase
MGTTCPEPRSLPIECAIDREASISCNVESDEQHPSFMKELLTAVAYLEPVPLSILQHALNRPLAVQAFEETLDEACKRCWLLVDENSDEPTYTLASESLKSKFSGVDNNRNTRNKIHLEYGRRIWNNVSQADLNHAATFIVGQFLQCSACASHIDSTERHSLSRLCLIAGTSAGKSSEFTQALTYAEFGIDLLGDTAWNSDTYDISLALHNVAAEMLMVKTDYEKMDKYIDAVIENATSQQDALLAKCTRLSAMGASQNENAAVDYAINLLETLGEKLPRRGNLLQIIWQVAVVKRLIGTKTDADLLLMKPMTDPNKLACMRIINTIVLRAFLVRPSLIALTGCKFMQLTLRYGMSSMSPNAFAFYSLMLVKSGDLKSADRFGRLSVAMLDQLGIIESLPRVYAPLYGSIFSLTKPARESLSPLFRAYEVGMQTGDLEFACLNISLHCMIAFSAGVALDEIKTKWEHSRQLMDSLKQKPLLRVSWASLQAVYRFMGIDSGLEEMPDDTTNLTGMLVTFVRVPQLVVAYIFEEEDFPYLEDCMKSQKMNPRKDYFIQWICSLWLLKQARSGKTKKRNALSYAWRQLPRLRQLQHLCPVNYLEKVFLLEAEIAALTNLVDKALIKYECCIAVAHKANTTYVEAMANERAARLLLELHRDHDSHDFMKAAFNCYHRWGACAKTKKMQAEFSFLLKHETLMDQGEQGLSL